MSTSSEAVEAPLELPVCLVTGGSGLLGHALQTVLSRTTHKPNPSSPFPSSSPSSSSSCSPPSSSSSPSSVEKSEGESSAAVSIPPPLAVLRGESFLFVFVGSKHANLRRFDEARRLFAAYRPKAIIHLAARVGGLFDNMAHNLEFFQENLEINENVVKLCHEFKVARGVFCLSTCIFPAKYAEEGILMDETCLHEGLPHPSNEGYSYAKRYLEISLRLHRQQYGWEWRCISPTNLYGPFDRFSLSRAHVLPALIHKAFLASREDKPLVVGGSGRPLRQFVYSEDAAEIILKVVHTPHMTEDQSHLILADDNPEGVSIAEVAETIANEFSLSHPLQFDTSRPDGIFRKSVSNARLRRFLGPDFQFVSLKEGISRTVKWFKENSTQIRP
ncbi:gdp-l-fucose synthetase [Cystoisospora suis]|uniref:GDP-L-fucose synthase n=1 Tax=Cystoisospora suis TaxID=483139 RepID=A0A2C6L5R7_9APIC|nr:gdp-l-fucose synthetase [Cystoisospora suis]